MKAIPIPTITALLGLGTMAGACGGSDAGKDFLTMTLLAFAGLILFCLSVMWLQVLIRLEERKRRYGCSQNYESAEVYRIQEICGTRSRKKSAHRAKTIGIT